MSQVSISGFFVVRSGAPRAQGEKLYLESQAAAGWQQ